MEKFPFEKKSLVLALLLLPFMTSTHARFSGTRAFLSGTTQTVHLSALDACRVEVPASDPVWGAGVQILGVTRDLPGQPEQLNEGYWCNVRLKDGSPSQTWGGVSIIYVCPTNSSVVSTRLDGQYLVGGVACECNSFYEERYGQCVDATQSANVVSADKNAGGGQGCSLEGNPVNPATGGKFDAETDYLSAAGPLPLEFSRTYNSSAVVIPATNNFSTGLVNKARRSVLGNGWRHSYERSLDFDNSNVAESAFGVGSIVQVLRPQGGTVSFTKTATGYSAESDVGHRFSSVGTGQSTVFSFFDVDSNTTEKFDSEGRLTEISALGGWKQTFEYSTAVTPLSQAPSVGFLVAVKDLSGRKLDFFYDLEGRLIKVLDPAAVAIQYAFDDSGNLKKVTYQDLSSREYLYGEAANLDAMVNDVGDLVSPNLPNALTGIIDENAQRFATYRYRADGKAISSEHAGSTEKYQFAYNNDGTVSVTNPLGGVRLHRYSTQQGNRLPVGVDKSCAVGGPNAIDFADAQYDASANPLVKKNFLGYQTKFTYNSRNLETSRTEALSSTGATLSSSRTISTDWHAQWTKPLRVAEPLKLTTYSYDAQGNLLKLTEQATSDASGSQGFLAVAAGSARVWSRGYNALGQVLSEDGPRSDAVDTAAYTYYSVTDVDVGKRGNLATYQNALGHVTQISAYNAHGKPLTIIDPNGVVTSLSYDSRQRLTKQVKGGETTLFAYAPTGLLSKATFPDGSYVTYGYDTAHRLIGITDNLGNKQAYTLDAAGNRTKEEVRDAAGTLLFQSGRLFDAYARLTKDLGAQGQLRAQYGYDLQGNLTSLTTPLVAGSKVVANAYDPLNRLINTTEPGSGTTQFGYDGQSNLVRTIDPRLLATNYVVDGLGNRTQVASPDTGNTLSTYDPMGNEISRKDAKGQISNYQYDALSRLVKTSYPDGSTKVYTWDQGTYGKGRLTKLEQRDPAGVLLLAQAADYDALGRVVTETRTVAGVSYVTQYRYANGKLVGMTYPSGKKIDYTLNALGQIATVKLTNGSDVTTLASSISYYPFGGIKGLTNGAGQALTWGMDQEKRPSSYVLAGKTWQLSYDTASNMALQMNTGDATQIANYVYDASNRLTQSSLPSVTYGFAYDLSGNRTTQATGGASRVYTTSTTSNRLQSVAGTTTRNFTYDLNGSVSSDGVASYAYDYRGRMKTVTVGGAATNYQLDANGVRVRKTGAEDVVYHYDIAGRLIAESNATGAMQKEYVWLDQQPVAVIQ